MSARYAFVCAVLLILVTSAVGTAATIEVSGNTALTANSEYDRNPSLTYHGSEYWLFWTKGDDTSTSGVRGGSYDPDADTYVVYYKKAGTIAGLASAGETKLTLSESARPANFDQRVVSAASFGGNLYAFVSSGQSGTNRGLYYYTWSGGSWSGPTTLLAHATAAGGHVNVTSDASYIYIVWESSDASSDCYTWDGTALSSKIDISNDNQPKITLAGSTLYVVSIEDGSGDIEVHSATAGGSPSFSSYSTAISGGGFYDPCIVSDGTDLYVVTAPYDGGNDQQYLVQTKYSGGSWSTVKRICLGGYGGTYWWDYWPVAYYDGGAIHVFFTTETASPSYSDAEIAYFELGWDLGNDHYFYVQNAIDEAVGSDVINVAAGSYDENLTVNKSLTLNGAQAGVDARGRSATESVITGSSGNLVYVNTGGVTIDGFQITGGGAGKLVFVDSGTDLVFQNNILDGTAQSGLYFGSTSSDVTIRQNKTDAAGFSAYAVFFDGGSDVFDNLIVSDNNIFDGEMYAGAKTFNSTGMVMSGNLFDGGDANLSSAFKNSTIDGNTFRNNSYTNMQVGLKDGTISNNVFECAGPSPYSGYPSYALMLWGDQYSLTPSENVDLEGNCFYYNEIASPGDLSHGLRILSGIDATTIRSYGNAFEDGGAQTGACGLVNQATGTTDASGNWWDTNVDTEVPGKISGDADYTPWLDDGTDLYGDVGFQGDFSELWVDDDSPQTGTDGRIEEGVGLVSGSKLFVIGGTYTQNSQVDIDKDIEIIGFDHPVVRPGFNTGSSGDSRGWWLCHAGRNVIIRGLEFDGSGQNVYQAIRAHGTGTLDDCTIKNIKHSQYVGMGLAFMDANWTVTGNTFENIERLGVIAFGSGVTGATISSNTYTGKGDGDWLDYGVELGGGAVATVTGNTITGCTGVASSDGSTSAGILITTYYASGTAGTLTYNNLPGNTAGIAVGYDSSDTSVCDAHYNNLAGNTEHGVVCTAASTSVDATLNWWGDATGPYHPDTNPSGLGIEVSDYVLYDPWIGKAGGENIVCDPDPLILNVGSTTGTIDVEYLGGGGGLMYAYSLTFTWDDGVADLTGITEGNLLSDAGTTSFLTYGTGNTRTVDCALLGVQPGVTGPGTMFTLAFSADSFGTTPVDLTIAAVRDSANTPLSGFYEDDGEIQVDITDPVVTNVAIENLTLSHTNGYAKDSDDLELTATVTDDYGLSASDITADFSTLLVGGGSAVPAEDYTSDVATWTSALANVTLQSDGLKTVTVTATDGLGNTGSGSDGITVDNTDPDPITGFAAAPAHEEVDLSWDNPSGLDTNYYGVVVRYDAWSDYPQYATSAPSYPADETSGDGEAYNQTGVVTGGTHGIVPRDIHYYTAFAYDWALNYGSADAGAQDRATNYWLGDVATTLGTWGYNGLVNAADIDKLGGTYAVANPTGNDAECDVGPTDDHSRVGIPEPDNFIGFEDLMIFAMNYGVVSPLVVPLLPDLELSGSELALVLSQRSMSPEGEFEVALTLEGNVEEVKGLTAEILFDKAEVEFVSARLSDEMGTPVVPVFFWHGAGESSVELDVAVLGTGVTIGGSGDVAVLTFRGLGEERTLEFGKTALRGAGNEVLEAELEGYESEPDLPVVFRLAGNAPNPFNPVTKVRYHVPHESEVTIRVYDVAGREVLTLLDGVVEPGRHEAVWDGRDAHGEAVGSGVYFCVMEAEGFHDSHKMTLLK